MPSDLPSRPEMTPEEREAHKVVDPTDRVKSVADKTDPRFEAARQKVDKEERLRKLRATKSDAADGDTGNDGDSAQDQEAPKPSGGFSFKNTGEPRDGGVS